MKQSLLTNYDFKSFRSDLFGGLTATVVIFPISLAFGVASGLGASAGLYGAIAVGFFAAVFGGTRTQISGPTAPMAVAMGVIVTSHAQSLSEAFTIVFIAGLLQVLLGLSGIGRFIAYTPRVVVSGFMSGIGIIVILIQVMPFIGAEPVSDGAMGALRALPDAIDLANLSAVIIATVTLAIAVFWPRKFRRYLPAPLLALVAGTVLSFFWLNDVPVIGQLPAGLPTLQLDLPSVNFLLRALEPALILALLGSVDSLISSLVADELTGTHHRPNRELVGQGIGNMVSGMFGGLAGSGSILGTVANIRAGGRSVVSGISYAIALVLILVGIGRFVEPIPLAALAGVLIKVGWDVIDWRIIHRIHLIQRDRLFVLLLTLSLTIFVDLLTAVVIGLIAAAMTHARTIEKFELDSVVSGVILDQHLFAGIEHLDKLDPFSARVGLLSLNGIFSVASSNRLVKGAAKDIKEHEVVIFDFSGTTYIDDDIALVIEQLMEVAHQDNIAIIVCGLPASVAKTMNALNVLRLVPQDRIVQNMEDARKIASRILEPDITEADSVN